MDIITLPIDNKNEILDGKYRMVIASVKRAKLLADGALPRKASKAQKITTLAIEEVVTKSVNVLVGDGAVAALEDASKLTHKRVMDEAQQKETMPEDVSELEKDLKAYLTEKNVAEPKKTIEDVFGDK